MNKKIFLSGLGITFCLGIGRVLGFLRDILIINFFGKTYSADVAVLILTIQDLLLGFFMGSAFSIALMSDFVGRVSNLGSIIYAYHKRLTFILIPIIFLFIFNIHFIIDCLAPGIPLEYKNQLAKYLPISIFSIPFTIYASITSSALNFIGFFVLPSLGNAILNFIVCLFLVMPFIFIGIDAFYSIALGVVFGALIRWIIQLKKIPFKRPTLDHKIIEINFKRFLNLYSGALLSSSSIFIIPIIARIFASEQGMGEIAIFNFVSKLIDFPISFFSGMVTTILIPRLIKIDNNWKVIFYSVLGLFFFFVFVLLGLYFLSDTLVGMLLMFGKVSSENISEIAYQLRNASWVLPGYGVTFFLVAAMATTKYSNFYGILCLTLNVLFYCFGHLYIKKFSDIYVVLNFIYSTLGVIGFILILIQLKFYPSKENSTQC